MMPVPLPGWVKWAALSILALAIFATGWVKGVDHAEDRHAAFVAQVAAAGAEQAARTGARIRQQQQITQETRDGYAQGLDALHRYYAVRLRHQPGPGGCAVPSVPGAAGGTDAGSPDAGTGARGTAPADPAAGNLQERCAVTTLMLLELRGWAERQQR